ncbi:PMR5N domain-containing protein [Psidium guajava]|nr:PMR5N domain-containing protein [Psidium guajava]
MVRGKWAVCSTYGLCARILPHGVYGKTLLCDLGGPAV